MPESGIETVSWIVRGCCRGFAGRSWQSAGTEAIYTLQDVDFVAYFRDRDIHSGFTNTRGRSYLLGLLNITQTITNRQGHYVTGSCRSSTTCKIATSTHAESSFNNELSTRIRQEYLSIEYKCTRRRNRLLWCCHSTVSGIVAK